jgi:hypothetical protein
MSRDDWLPSSPRNIPEDLNLQKTFHNFIPPSVYFIRTSRLSNTVFAHYCYTRVKQSDNIKCRVTQREVNYLEHTSIQQARQAKWVEMTFILKVTEYQGSQPSETVTHIPARTSSSPELP